MNRTARQIVDHGLNWLMKVYDFLLVNATLHLVALFFGLTLTVVDVFEGLFFATLVLLVGEYTGVYRIDSNARFSIIFRTELLTNVLAVLMMSAMVYLFQHFPGSDLKGLEQLTINVFYVSSFVLLLGSRYAINVYSRTRSNCPNIAILGLTDVGRSIEEAMVREYGTRVLNKLDIYDERSTERVGQPLKGHFKGGLDELMVAAKAGQVDQVYVALPMIARDKIKNYLKLLSDTTVDTFIVPDLYTYNLQTARIKRVDNMHTFSVFASPFDGLGGMIKRWMDLIIGALITLLILPILIAVAIGVKLSSPGPVLFKQDRYGLGGKKIKVWKFRSMRVMENDEVVKQATKGDPRVTKFGAFIRRTSLDELPQFFNVLQGSMSIVGPRPHAVSHNEQYRQIVDNYMIRHKVKPGITGLAQIKGFRGETDTLDKMEMRVMYDIRYLQNWTPLYDIKIILMTVLKGFVGKTAY